MAHAARSLSDSTWLRHARALISAFLVMTAATVLTFAQSD